jgi:hypothetical protein
MDETPSGIADWLSEHWLGSANSLCERGCGQYSMDYIGDHYFNVMLFCSSVSHVKIGRYIRTSRSIWQNVTFLWIHSRNVAGLFIGGFDDKNRCKTSLTRLDSYLC